MALIDLPVFEASVSTWRPTLDSVFKQEYGGEGLLLGNLLVTPVSTGWLVLAWVSRSAWDLCGLNHRVASPEFKLTSSPCTCVEMKLRARPPALEVPVLGKATKGFGRSRFHSCGRRHAGRTTLALLMGVMEKVPGGLEALQGPDPRPVRAVGTGAERSREKPGTGHPRKAVTGSKKPARPTPQSSPSVR